LSSRCKDLKDVCFGSTLVGDEGVRALANGCPKLQRIDFAHCSAISDLSIVTIAQKCPRLERVVLNGCPSLTSTSLTALIRHCPSLQSVNLSETSVESVSPLLLSLTKLKHFSVDRCSRMVEPPASVTREGLDAIRAFYKEYNTSNRYANLPTTWLLLGRRFLHLSRL